MPTIDIALPEEIKEQLELPRCADIRFEKPVLPKLTIPTGGELKAVADFSKGIPNDCSLNLNLILQLQPVLISMQCLFEVLKLLGAMQKFFEAVKGDVFAAPSAAAEVAKAFEGIAHCITFPFGVGAFLFIADLLRLIGKILQCLGQQFKSLANLMGRLELRIATAQSTGNAELLEALNCAKDNAVRSGQSAMLALEPITLILSLAEPFMGIAGIDPIKLPQLGAPEDVEALDTAADSLLTVSATLLAIADGIKPPE
jgi:hypothetical protein